MSIRNVCLSIFFSILIITGCSHNISESSSSKEFSTVKKQGQHSGDITTASPTKKLNYDELRQKITYGQATIAEVFQAFTERDVVGLTNTLHGLYSMRWHRAVHHLYYDLWYFTKEKYPDFSWDLLEKIPARLALASTINRAQIFDTEEFKNYIHAHKYDEHEFHRAQVVVSLGLNGDPDDVEYISEMADADNLYVSQSAITSLALMAHPKAQKAMEELWIKHQRTPRGDLLQELLDKAYYVKPEVGKKQP